LTRNGKVTSFNFGSKSRDTYLLVFYVAVAMSFFYVVSLNQRNYQDVWILDGIVVPTAIFVCFSLIVEMLIHENRKLVIFAAFFLFAMSLIPGLKYESFCGCFDSPAHFRFTNEMVSLGHIPENEYYSNKYGGNPGMHIFMSCVSTVSGIPVNDVFKFVFPAVLSIVPFIIYFITKDLLSYAIQRYTIIASGFPIITAYVVWGTNLGMIPYLFLIAIFLRRIFAKRRAREFLLLFALVGFGLIISHAVAALFAAFLLLGTPLVLKLLHRIRTKTSMPFLSRFLGSTSMVPPLLYVALLATWWINMSNINLEILAGYMRTLFTGATMTAPIPVRFYQVPILARLRVLTVFHLADFVMGVLSLLGLFIFLRKSRRKDFSHETQAIYLLLTVLLGIIVLFLSFQFAFRFGALQYGRFVDYAIPLCSPLAGLALWRLNRSLPSLNIRIRNLAFASFLFVLVSCCLVSFLRCQPLVPTADVLSSDLPENEYLVDVGMINTIYQIKMISFAERYCSNATITSDSVTMTQIWGFSDHSFYSRRIRENPLTTIQDQNSEWNMFLLHTRRAGPLQEGVEYRTRERIEDLRLKTGNVIYDNGESFLISRENPA